MYGGILAILAGLVPFLRDAFFGDDGWLSPFSTSIENLGSLYTCLQLFVLGAHLYSKKGECTNNPPSRTASCSSSFQTGSLFTTLQLERECLSLMENLPATHSFSFIGSSPPIIPMIFLFTYRFLIAPSIGGGLVLGMRKLLGEKVMADKVLDFVLVSLEFSFLCVG